MSFFEPNSTAETLSDQDKAQKVQALRDMINNAEQTIQSAKAMLLQLEGKKKAGRRRKVEEIDGGSVVQGTFDGQVMVGTDGKRYPVPANYASKSKLVQGDMLKLTMSPDSSFIYKQIGPVERKHQIGIITQDEHSNYVVVADGKAYRVLLASITYFRCEPGDEVAIILPRDLDAQWAAIDNVLQKGAMNPATIAVPAIPKHDMEHWKSELKDEERPTPSGFPKEEVSEEEEEEAVDVAPAVIGKQSAAPNTPAAAPAPAAPQDAAALRQAILDEWAAAMEKDKPE